MWEKCLISCWKWESEIKHDETECKHKNVGKFWGKNKWKLHTETFKCFVWAVSNMDNARKKYVDIERLFLAINFIMGINKLSSLEDYWSTNKCIRNEKIQNVMTRTRFQSILQNLHFSNNDSDDKIDKSYKSRPVIEHLNKVFAESLSNRPFQSVDEYMCKFKGRSSMKQYIKSKWSLKYWYRCDSKQATSIS